MATRRPRMLATALLVFVLTIASQNAEAFWGVSNLDYTPPNGEGGGDTLSGYSASYRHWWDVIYSRWYDYYCECYIQQESTLAVFLTLLRADGSLAGNAAAFEPYPVFNFSGIEPDQPGDWTLFGDHNARVRIWDEGLYYCGGFWPCEVVTDFWATTADQARVARCGDQRDDIIAQYPAKSVPWTPECDDFTQSVPVQSYYDFSQWRSHEFPWDWAVLREQLVGNNTCIINNAIPLGGGYVVPPFNSGYRNSMHMHGLAADVSALGQEEWDAYRYIAKDSGACGFACVEPRIQAPVWFHHDYRPTTCPTGW
jgi:hypothetical protein